MQVVRVRPRRFGVPLHHGFMLAQSAAGRLRLRPVNVNNIEFVAEEDRLAGNNIITRIERRNTATANLYDLWYVRLDGDVNPPAVLVEHPMLRGVREALFILEYEPGPKLKRATIDLTIQPNDVQDGYGMGLGNDAPVIRLVASAVPKQLN